MPDFTPLFDSLISHCTTWKNAKSGGGPIGKFNVSLRQLSSFDAHPDIPMRFQYLGGFTGHTPTGHEDITMAEMELKIEKDFDAIVSAIHSVPYFADLHVLLEMTMGGPTPKMRLSLGNIPLMDAPKSGHVWKNTLKRLDRVITYCNKLLALCDYPQGYWGFGGDNDATVRANTAGEALCVRQLILSGAIPSKTIPSLPTFQRIEDITANAQMTILLKAL